MSFIELSRDLVRDLDGEYITQKGFIRSGIEVKRFESDSADLCSTRTQEVELKVDVRYLWPLRLVAYWALLMSIWMLGQESIN